MIAVSKPLAAQLLFERITDYDLRYQVPPGEVKLYRSPFFRDFWHLNVAMMTSNNALVPDPDKDDIIASKPFDWPLLHLGMRMNGWHDTSIKYYLVRPVASRNRLVVIS